MGNDSPAAVAIAVVVVVILLVHIVIILVIFIIFVVRGKTLLPPQSSLSYVVRGMMMTGKEDD